jgi:hypothetical protein
MTKYCKRERKIITQVLFFNIVDVDLVKRREIFMLSLRKESIDKHMMKRRKELLSHKSKDLNFDVDPNTLYLSEEVKNKTFKDSVTYNLYRMNGSSSSKNSSIQTALKKLN